MKKLIIARHGNTFTAEQTPTRVGCRTDLLLVEEQLSKNIGQYLVNQHIKLDRVFAAPLKRTMRTAQLILEASQQNIAIEPISDFIEIDYGPDENQPEDIIIERLGKITLNKQNIAHPSKEQIIQAGNTVIDQWNNQAIPPFDWHVDVKRLIASWQNFANNIHEDETILVVSSNGIIRFAPHILEGVAYDKFIQNESIKVKTGSLSIFENNNGKWACQLWNKRP